MRYTASNIAESLEATVRDGHLAAGTRLPTHRELAHQHGVALNTASRAMQLLKDRGLIVGEVGRGSFVRAPGHVDSSEFGLHTQTSKLIDLARNVMPLDDIAKRFESAAQAVLRREHDTLMAYQPHAGRAVDRAAAATWMARRGHLPNDPSRVLICVGAQHAITMALMAVARPGDAIAVEAVTWPGIQASAAALGLTLVPIPMDENGLRPRTLLRLATKHRIVALYCMPSLQNPTCISMPLKRRETLAALARRLDLQIVEDDAYGFLDVETPPPLAALAPERTWYVRSLSKSLAPGLRTAWLLAPPAGFDRASRMIRATVWTAPSLGPAIASHWVADGTAEILEKQRCTEAAARQDIAAAILPSNAYLRTPAMHVWFKAPRQSGMRHLVDRADAAGVRISPGIAFGVGCSPTAARLSLCAPASRSELRKALNILKALI